MIESKPVNEVEVGLFELLLAIAERKRFVFRFTLIAAVLVTIFCFVVPMKWESRSLFAPIADDTASIQLNAGLLNSFSNMPLLASQKMDMAVDFMTIMDSRTFREGIIRNFNMIGYFKITEPDTTIAMEKALKKLNNSVIKLSLEPQTSTISLSVLTKDKRYSQNIAKYIIKALEHYIKYQKKVKSKITREFLEQRTAVIKTKIDSLMSVNRKFESGGKAYSLDEQTTKALDLYSELVSKKIMNDLDLEVARLQYEASSPKVIELETTSDLYKTKIADFENNHSGTLPKYMLQLRDLPEVSMQYHKIQLDLRIMNKVYEYIYPILESSRLMEIKDMPAIEVLDSPSFPGKHAYPKRLLLISLLTFAAFLLGCLFAILAACISTEQKTQLNGILNSFIRIKTTDPDKKNNDA
jgi:capsule polysaccharide export protein KpsE/RkpR